MKRRLLWILLVAVALVLFIIANVVKASAGVWAAAFLALLLALVGNVIGPFFGDAVARVRRFGFRGRESPVARLTKSRALRSMMSGFGPARRGDGAVPDATAVADLRDWLSCPPDARESGLAVAVGDDTQAIAQVVCEACQQSEPREFVVPYSPARFVEWTRTAAPDELPPKRGRPTWLLLLGLEQYQEAGLSLRDLETWAKKGSGTLTLGSCSSASAGMPWFRELGRIARVVAVPNRQQEDEQC